MREDTLQIQCVQWFRMQFPGKIIYAIPNGGSRHIVEAVKLKRTGVLRGIPDLCIPHPRGKYHGAYLELKVGHNKQTKPQKEIMEILKEENYFVGVVYYFESFVNIVKVYFDEKTKL